MSTPVPTPDADDLPPETRAARQVAAATRRLTRALLTRRPPAAELDATTTTLEALAARLERAPEPSEPTTGLTFGSRLDPTRFERHPFLGPSNPLAPPVVLDPDDGQDAVVASVVLDARHQGGHGHAHGGWVAALFDQVLAVAGARVAGQPTVTGTLTVRYLQPTPIGLPLRLTATASRTGGRTLRARGTLVAGTVETATGDAVLVLVQDTPEPDASATR